jgi:hypothetical protein
MSCFCIKGFQNRILYKECKKCNCNFKVNIGGRSERRSCNYHNFKNNYCYDCGIFRHQLQNENCFHIKNYEECLCCIIS